MASLQCLFKVKECVVNSAIKIFVGSIYINCQMLFSAHLEMTTFIEAGLMWASDIFYRDIDVLYVPENILHFIT